MLLDLFIAKPHHYGRRNIKEKPAKRNGWP
jgi:hypothetical protein